MRRWCCTVGKWHWKSPLRLTVTAKFFFPLNFLFGSFFFVHCVIAGAALWTWFRLFFRIIQLWCSSCCFLFLLHYFLLLSLSLSLFMFCSWNVHCKKKEECLSIKLNHPLTVMWWCVRLGSVTHNRSIRFVFVLSFRIFLSFRRYFHQCLRSINCIIGCRIVFSLLMISHSTISLSLSHFTYIKLYAFWTHTNKQRTYFEYHNLFCRRFSFLDLIHAWQHDRERKKTFHSIYGVKSFCLQKSYRNFPRNAERKLFCKQKLDKRSSRCSSCWKTAISDGTKRASLAAYVMWEDSNESMGHGRRRVKW